METVSLNSYAIEETSGGHLTVGKISSNHFLYHTKN